MKRPGERAATHLDDADDLANSWAAARVRAYVH
jgi:hypothetical protein